MCVTLSMFYILSVLCHNTLRQKSLFSASLSVRLIVSHSDKHTHTHAYTDTHFSLKLSTPSLPPSLYHSDSHARTHPRTQLCAHVSVTEPHARKFFCCLSLFLSLSPLPPPISVTSTLSHSDTGHAILRKHMNTTGKSTHLMRHPHASSRS